MRVVRAKSSRSANKPLKSAANGKQESFRDLKAFGLWADRTDLKDPVQFTKELRIRMEHGSDGR
jgi:hypothetical protein